MLVASDGPCSDSAYSFVIRDGAGQYGHFQKQYSPEGQAMEPFSIASGKEGGYLLAGNYYPPSANGFLARTTVLAHIDGKGCDDWSWSMASGQEQVIQAMIGTADSGFLISSFPYQAPQDNYPVALNVLKLGRDGAAQWARSYSNGSAVANFYSAVCETTDKGFLLETGSFPLSGSPSQSCPS